MRYQAPFNRVAIKPDPAEEKSKGGIILLPDEKAQKGFKGTVFSAGPDCKIHKAGDRIFYNNHGGQSIKLKQVDGKIFELFVFLEQELLGSAFDEDIEGIEGVDYSLEDSEEVSEEISLI